MYAPDSEDCLLFNYEFTGIISVDKILEQVDSDMLRYLDDDFHIEINDDFYHQCLSCVKTNEEFSTEQAATDSVRRAKSSLVTNFCGVLQVNTVVKQVPKIV